VAEDVETLHEALFGFRPAKPGTAYERLSALVLASVGWSQVTHDVEARGKGRRAAHQIDVVAADPSGSISRLLVECKDWRRAVGKQTVDALAGVRSQVGADAAAIVTMVGYTKGALAVASDEDIALLRLQPYDPDPTSRQTRFVERIELRIAHNGSGYSDFGVELLDPSEVSEPWSCQLSSAHYLQRLDGRRAEQLHQLLMGHSAGMREGRFEHRVDFPEGRLLSLEGVAPVRISALKWAETVVRGETVSVTEMQGTPAVVIEQLDDHGTFDSGKLVVSEDLFAWDISGDGAVVPRGQIGPRLSESVQGVG
jgi:restriction endonuclease